MNTFNRAFIALLALAWVAILGAIIWLVWDQARLVEVSTTALDFRFDVTATTQAEQILATVIAGALMLPALMLLALEMKPSRRREEVRTADDRETDRMQSRIDTLERDLAEERARNDGERLSEADTRERGAGSRRWRVFPRH